MRQRQGLTIAQAAGALGLDPRTVATWVARSRFEPRRSRPRGSVRHRCRCPTSRCRSAILAILGLPDDGDGSCRDVRCGQFDRAALPTIPRQVMDARPSRRKICNAVSSHTTSFVRAIKPVRQRQPHRQHRPRPRAARCAHRPCVAGPEEKKAATPDEPRVLPCPCPRCGDRMIVIEVFAPGCEPRYRPTPAPTPIRIDTS